MIEKNITFKDFWSRVDEASKKIDKSETKLEAAPGAK